MKVFAKTFTKYHGCFLLFSVFVHLFIPFFLELVWIPITVILLAKEIMVRGAERLAGKSFPVIGPPVFFIDTKCLVKVAATSYQHFVFCFGNNICQFYPFVVEPNIYPVVDVFALNQACCQSPNLQGPKKVTCFCTEIADAHTSHVFPFTAGCTTDGMNCLVYDVFEQSGFKMGNNTIGCAIAHPIRNLSSHNDKKD